MAGAEGAPGDRDGSGLLPDLADGGRDVPKTVRWWAMRCLDGEFTPTEEVDHLRWLAVPQAVRRVTAGRDSTPLLAFSAQPPRTATVLLLRHASAGDRDGWSGEDDLRPLDERGREQARAVADVLTAYAPQAVRSAPPRRCQDTVRPLADRLGLAVEQDDRLSERTWAADPTAVVAAVCELGAGEGSTVACSQGGAVQEAVAALTAQAGTPLDRVRARKGSLWALSFSAGRLVDADHTPELRLS